jgi:excinuclease ABC subunit C
MSEPVTALPSEIDSLPDRPAVFLLWAAEGAPYLARTALLRRRLRRLIRHVSGAEQSKDSTSSEVRSGPAPPNRDRVSRVLNLNGVAERIEYWPTGSQLESALVHLELARRYFPQDWPRITRLKPPAFVRLTLDNPFPRTMITTRLGRRFFYGPFPSRAAADRFNDALLDLFQIRRCEENLAPAPNHPGCIYGEMNRCLRPCQQAVSMAEYGGEAARMQQFLETGGASLRHTAEAARERASADMQFEEAERMHQRAARIAEVQTLAGELARPVDRLAGVAVTGSAAAEAVDLWFLAAGRWQQPRRVSLSETTGAGSSLDRRMRELIASITPAGEPDLEHLSILVRWLGSSWRDGEWIGFDSFEKLPYRKLVNAIGRVAASAVKSRL